MLGPELAGEIIQTVNTPAVAIGGLDTTNLPAVLAAGTINFSVVRAVCQATAPFDAIRHLMDIWQKAMHAVP